MRASIITPTLNAIDWIEGCVANVLQQGDAVLEHIVVDGGSRDGTVEKIRALSRAHRHLTLVALPECGQSAAMNRGSGAASGEVIGILNADDFYEPETVRRAVAILNGADAPAFVAGDCLIADAARRYVWNRPRDLRIESLLLGWDLAQFPCNPSAYFYRREVHRTVGGYDPADDFTMDMDFVFKCAAQVVMRYVPEHWGNFRLFPGGKTFEDAAGPQRRAAIIARHVQRLDAEQRAAMERIRREKQLYWSGSSAFGAASLVTSAGSGSTLTPPRRGAALGVRLSSLLPLPDR